MAKPNYKFEKRQKEMAKQKKKQEKLKRKEMKKQDFPDDDNFGQDGDDSGEEEPET